MPQGFEGRLDPMGLSWLPGLQRQEQQQGCGGARHEEIQVDFQRLSRVLPACTIRAIEETIIDNASSVSPRPAISAARMRSAAVGGWAARAMEPEA